MNNELINVNYEGEEVIFKVENGISYVRIDEVATFCGFGEYKGNKFYPKWSRINSYLSDLNFSTQVAKGDFIPEHIMYALIGKAKNDKATKFMLWVGQVLTEIRTTGKYDCVEHQIKLIEDEVEKNLKLTIYQYENIVKMNPTDILSAMMLTNKRNELNTYLQSKELEEVKGELDNVKKAIDNFVVIGDRKQFTNEVNSVARATGESQSTVYSNTYKLLKDDYGIDLQARVRNRKEKIQNERLDQGKKPLSPASLKSKVNALVIADEENLWRELGLCLFEVKKQLITK